MPRRLRQPSSSGVHHVMNRGVDRAPIFFADVDRLDFLGRLVELRHDHGVETLAYCLMGNHYHLIVRVLDGGDLSMGMHHLGLSYVRHTNDRVGRDGPLFRARFHSIPITTDAYLMVAARYVHRNPLVIAGIDQPAAYRWSSYRTFLGHRRVPSFLDIGPVLGVHGDDVDAMASFTDNPDATAEISTVADVRQLIALGLADSPTSDSIRRARTADERAALVLVAARLGETHPLARTIERHLDWPSPEARRKAHARARQRSASPEFERVVSLVHQQLPRAA